MKSEIILAIFAFLLLGTVPFSAIGQSGSIADHVVINEVDTNPPGSDSETISEWVELYNPTDKEIDVGGWKVASTTVLKKTFVIPQGTTIKPQQFLKFLYQSVWFTDANERIELLDSAGIVIDATPSITDFNNDYSSWQRVYDGLDTNSFDDWKFETSTAGSTNGKLVIEEEDERISVTAIVDKPNYLFDETAIISGTVSEQIFVEFPFFHQETIDVVISGPNYDKQLTLYPDLNLEYETSLKLQKNLGITEGVYNVSIDYAGTTTETHFSVGEVKIEIKQKEATQLIIATDKEFYIPGETATIFAKTSEIIEFEGLKYVVINPDGDTIYQGTLYPNINALTNQGLALDEFGQLVFTDPIRHQDAQFATSIFMDTVSPSYGSYTIFAQYGTQLGTGDFNLNEDVKEDAPISLITDKQVYKPGDNVLISGRLNNQYVYTMNLNVDQTKQTSLFAESFRIMKIKDVVRLEGDSSFTYEFRIPDTHHSLGDFRVTVSENVGKAVVFFNVVENPDAFVTSAVDTLTVSTDKLIYDIGERMVISGNVGKIQSRTSLETPVVSIFIMDEDGNPLSILALLQGSKAQSRIAENVIGCYILTGIPDIGGNFRVEDSISISLYKPGTYHLKAIYSDSRQGIWAVTISGCPNLTQIASDVKATTSFSVVDPLDLGGDRFAVQLNKEVYGLGEMVFLEGIIPGLPQGNEIKFTLIKPNGVTHKFITLPDDSKFSWSWKTPSTDGASRVTNDRVVTSSNYGIYQLVVGTKTASTNVFFKVSPNPEEDTIEIAPLEVTTEKPVYNAGETLTVLGTAIKRPQGMEGLVVPERAKIIVSSTDFPPKQFYEAFVDLDSGGNFKGNFDLPVTIFKDGNYKATAIYQELRAESLFAINNEIFFDRDRPLILLLDTDKDEYQLGETVKISGRATKIVYLDDMLVTVVHEDDLKITCGSFICGRPGSSLSITLPQQAVFTTGYTIPISSDAIGKYEVIVDTEFGVYSTTFSVISKPDLVPEEKEAIKVGTRMTEKFNRISDSFVPITVAEKTFDDGTLLPRVLQGSLLTPTRGEEANVNIKISTQDGICIIGQEAECLVKNLTRSPGTIYQVVEIDGVNYKIRYSGPDARLEKFTILPESFWMPDSTWNVEVIKDEQPSRLYYRITYIISE